MKTKNICFFILTLFLAACSNQPWEFDNFDYTTSYFPWTYPVRTIVLGDADYDTSNDKLHQFLISAAIGGEYKNKEDIVINYKIDETLLDNLYFANTDGRKVKLMPASYYTLSDPDKIIVAKGSYSGGVMVKLSDDFFADPDACKDTYVIPLRIVSASTDSILSGSPATDDPDPRVAADWKKVPMDFTLFCVKYANPFQGHYLLRGNVCDILTPSLSAKYGYGQYNRVEEGIVTPLSTISLTSLAYSQPIRVVSGSSPGSFSAIIVIDPTTGTALIKSDSTSQFEVSGTGSYVKNGQSWGGKSRNALYLSYRVKSADKTYQMSDTLTFRDNMVSLEEFSPEIK